MVVESLTESVGGSIIKAIQDRNGAGTTDLDSAIRDAIKWRRWNGRSYPGYQRARQKVRNIINTYKGSLSNHADR